MRVHNNLALQRGFELIVSMKTALPNRQRIQRCFLSKPVAPKRKMFPDVAPLIEGHGHTGLDAGVLGEVGELVRVHLRHDGGLRSTPIGESTVLQKPRLTQLRMKARSTRMMVRRSLSLLYTAPFPFSLMRESMSL